MRRLTASTGSVFGWKSFNWSGHFACTVVGPTKSRPKLPQQMSFRHSIVLSCRVGSFALVLASLSLGFGLAVECCKWWCLNSMMQLSGQFLFTKLFNVYFFDYLLYTNTHTHKHRYTGNVSFVWQSQNSKETAAIQTGTFHTHSCLLSARLLSSFISFIFCVLLLTLPASRHSWQNFFAAENYRKSLVFLNVHFFRTIKLEDIIMTRKKVRHIF